MLKPFKIVFYFDTEDQDVIEEALIDFHNRVTLKVRLEPGLSYWLYSKPGCRIGTCKVEGTR